jgi:hypothetical protein
MSDDRQQKIRKSSETKGPASNENLTQAKSHAGVVFFGILFSVF